jgi:hypothetical protein
MKVRICRPARTAMQSGTAKTHKWKLKFASSAKPMVDPLMGWFGMKDTTQQLDLEFDTCEAAIHYAKANQLAYEVDEPHVKSFKPKSYAANFASDRVE